MSQSTPHLTISIKEQPSDDGDGTKIALGIGAFLGALAGFLLGWLAGNLWPASTPCTDSASPGFGALPTSCTHPAQRLVSSDGVALCLCPRDRFGRQVTASGPVELPPPAASGAP